VADEANDAAEDDDPSEDGDDSLYLTVATCGNDNGSSSSTSSIIIIPPVSSSHSSPSVLASSLGGLASDMDNIGILSDDSGPKLTAYGHSKRKRFQGCCNQTATLMVQSVQIRIARIPKK